MTGKPVIRGTRLTVELILKLLASGATSDEIVEEYSGLTKDDIRACLFFAMKSLEDTSFMQVIYLADCFVVVTNSKVRFARPPRLE
jgi:uncharacterized protein (DUF433 family)